LSIDLPATTGTVRRESSPRSFSIRRVVVMAWLRAFGFDSAPDPGGIR
jgi:hypothetical protein